MRSRDLLVPATALERERAFTLVELILVMAIIGVLVAMLLPAAQRVREAATKLECMNNLRQVGIALHNMESDRGAFPPGWTGSQFYYNLLPYVEQSSNLGDTPIKLFLCPARRDLSAGPKSDYGTADLDLPYVAGRCLLSETPINRTEVVDGMSNVLMLAHKGMDPRYYYKTPPVSISYVYGLLADCRDLNWTVPSGVGGEEFSIIRFGGCVLRDQAGGHDLGMGTASTIMYPPAKIPCFELMTSPHPVGMPCLWADGRVNMLAYSKNPKFPGLNAAMNSGNFALPAEGHVLMQLWSCQDGDLLGQLPLILE